MTEPDGRVERISRRGRWVRLAIGLGFAGVVWYGTVHGSEQMYPAGPMTQYAFYIGPNGAVDSITLEADTTAGTHVVVPLTASGVGIKRADIEIQLPAILRQPSKLQAVADAQRRLHRSQPQYRTIYVVDTATPLHDRVPQPPVRRILTTWHVP